MKVTIITVCFNSASTIERAIRSVAEQTWADIEHIVVDGASSDDTVAIVRRNSARVATLISEPDRGVYEAMNKGIALATGDVVCFLNADDVYSHNRVIESVALAMQESELDALYGNVTFFRSGDINTVVRTYNSGRFTPKRIGWGWMPAHPALFVKRKFFQTYGPFREEFKIAGDFEFVARIFKNDQIKSKFIPEVFVRMQMGGLSTSGLASNYRLNKEILLACKQNGIYSNWMMLFAKYFLKLGELVNAS
jgi:glycosyltransferase involved in cell wall biosynthesis